MKVYDKLIRVSKSAILEKLFDVKEEKLSKAELKKVKPFLPTEEEREFMEIYRSNIPQLARLQRKMSVCLDVEVTELEEEKISFVYGKNTYTLTDPPNSYKLCQSLEKGSLAGVVEMGIQGCIVKNGETINDVKAEKILKVDELKLIEKISAKFFFQIFLA